MKTLYIAAIAALCSLTAAAQTDNTTFDADNGVVTIGADRMFQIESKDGKFSFKPYLMLQTPGNYNYYDDEGLDKAYNQDNVANSGFSFPSAVLGFTGKAYSMVTYNLSVNAAKSGLKAALAAEMKKGLEIRPVKGNVLRLVAKDGSGFFDLSDTEIASLLKPVLGEMKI